MSEFELIPDIAERIKRSKMELQDSGLYWAPEWDSQSCCDQDYVNNFKKGWDARQSEIDKLKAEKAGLEKRVNEITHLATELAEYASYAEIVGAVTHNRSAVRKYCDEIFDFNRKVDDELEQALRGGRE